MAGEIWKVIIKNNSGSTQTIEDLGISIVDSSQITFSDQYDYDEIAGSDDLRALVNAGTLVVNDGVGDLSAANGVKWLSIENIKDVRDNHYTKTELQSDTAGVSVDWGNIINAPSFGDPTWTEPVEFIVDAISASAPAAGSKVNAVYVNTTDDNYYQWSGSAWSSIGAVSDGDRVINQLDVDDPIYSYATSGDTWTDLGTPTDATTVIVNDDGDGKSAQYVYDTTTLWTKIGDIDFTGHFDGGASKHDASEIDVEGAYTYVTSGGSVEDAIGDIDSQLGTNATAASNAQSAANAAQSDIDSHTDGGASKHDASEIDVEGAYTYVTSGGSVEDAIGDIDTTMVALSAAISTGNIPALDDHLNGGASKHDASEIDVEGTYTYVTSGGSAEDAIGDIDSQLGTNATAASNAQSAANAAQSDIDSHTDGGASKHDASEIDVEGAYTYVTSGGSAENAISDIDTELGTLHTSIDGHLDGGANKHDASEIDVEGTYTNLSTSDLETVIGEIDGLLDSANNSLDDAYDQGGAGLGRIVIADAGAVKLDASSNFYAPLELSTQSAAPTAGLAMGQVSNINGILCVYDATRSKWLSVQRYFLTFGRKGNTKNQYLNFGGGNLPSNNSGFRLMRGATIVGMSAQIDASGTCTFNVRKDDVLTNITSLGISAALGNQVTTTNIDVAAGSYLQSYLGAGSTVADPMFIVEVAWNLT